MSPEKRSSIRTVRARACWRPPASPSRVAPSEVETLGRRMSGALVIPAPPQVASLNPPTDPRTGRDYDPWEPVNERTFSFNFNVLDRYGLKPAATVWDNVLPQPVTLGLVNAFDNLDMPKRFVNNVLQGRLQGANRELIRFLVNSTVGVAGYIRRCDRARSSEELCRFRPDVRQPTASARTLPGTALLPPLTVRDGIGYGTTPFLIRSATSSRSSQISDGRR